MFKRLSFSCWRSRARAKRQRVLCLVVSVLHVLPFSNTSSSNFTYMCSFPVASVEFVRRDQQQQPTLVLWGELVRDQTTRKAYITNYCRREMKFCKKYQEYMQEQDKKLPGVGFKKLKKILKNCSRREVLSEKDVHGVLDIKTCPQNCSVCDGTFFPSLLKEMSDVVGCFNERAQKLLELHLASGFRKYFIWFKGKLQGSHVALIQEGKDLVNYALINAIAIRKILKKYDKVHLSKQGQAFRSRAQSMHIEILQSPWLCELMAFHINLRETKAKSGMTPALFEGCYLTFNDGKPFLSCELFDSVKLDIDLTCSICLDTVFDPVSLTCGHIFCYMCACSAASVTIVNGLKAAEPKEKCPLCREAGVYEGFVDLDELSILLKRSCREYWEQRLRTERTERVRQAKEHWESECRAFIGV